MICLFLLQLDNVKIENYERILYTIIQPAWTHQV